VENITSALSENYYTRRRAKGPFWLHFLTAADHTSPLFASELAVGTYNFD